MAKASLPRFQFPDKEAVVKAFWLKVRVGKPDECWKWLGALTGLNGYGVFYVRPHTYRTHRLSYYLATGVEPKLFILHSCDNPPCVNPNHLREGTPADNSRDAVERHRTASGERNVFARLREEQVKQAIAWYGQGLSPIEISRRLGCSDGAISNIVCGHTWKHLSQGIVHRGRQYSANQGNNLKKLTEDQVLQILKLHSQGVSRSEIGRRFSVHTVTVGLIVNRKRWKRLHLTEIRGIDRALDREEGK